MRVIVFSSLFAVSFASLASESVHACPPMQAVILIDQSGSMASPGSTGAAKWQIARDKAFSDFSTLPSGTIVAIAGFDNATTGGTPYYHRVINFVDNQVKGVNDAFLLGKIADTAADLGNLTPLAGAACDGLSDVWTFIPGGDPSCTTTTGRDLYLYSDGLENSTPAGHACAGTNSATAFNVSLAGMGFGLTPGSWQRRVANMAYNGSPNVDFIPIPDNLRPVVNVSLLFDFVGAFASSPSWQYESDPHASAVASAPLPASVDANGIAFFKGLSNVTFGTYFEATQIHGVETKIPMPGDTNPEPTLSCVDQLDLNRILEVFGRRVRNNDPQFSGAELARRDVNNDLVININDYALATQNFGKCR